MDPGLFFGGVIAGLLLSQAWVSTWDEPAVAPGAPTHPKISQAQATFLPHTAQSIQIIRATEPEVASSWKAMASRLPYLTEAVAMYYAMEDPRVPLTPKLTIAGSLIYLVSPADVIPDTIPFIGQLDDIGILLAALKYVYGHISHEHMEKARQWLISQGVDPKPLFAIGKDMSELPAQAVQAQQQGVLPFPTPTAPPGPPQLPGPVAPAGPPQLPGPQGPQGGTPGFGSYHDDQPPAPPPSWGW